MGKDIESIRFSEQDYERFSQRLRDNLEQMWQLLRQPGFGKGPGSFGAELEFYIIDHKGSPLGRNIEIRDSMDEDEQVTLELNRFNLEYNLRPEAISGHPFSRSEHQLLNALRRLRRCASEQGGRIVPVGILPTLELQDFDHRTMTDLSRFHALRNKLQEERAGLFRIDISGEDNLSLATDDITLEGANTSFQAHYRVDPEVFADTFNAIQLVTPLVLALGANSPLVFGQRLWHESRIPLFKKSIDSRREESLDSLHWQQPARVNFGHGWVRDGAYELFAEATRLYPPLLPIVRDSDEEPGNGAPSLAELRMQLGTVWLWNRPVYDPSGEGHLRIEMRSLPSGPSVTDMMANAALMIGLAEGLRDEVRELITALPFRHATHNFYRAAQSGLRAQLVWPSLEQSRLGQVRVDRLAERLLPVAEEGLLQIGVDSEDVRHYLDIIANRIAAQRNGANWQLDSLAHYTGFCPKKDALHRVLELYYRQSLNNKPVSQWHLHE